MLLVCVFRVGGVFVVSGLASRMCMLAGSMVVGIIVVMRRATIIDAHATGRVS